MIRAIVGRKDHGPDETPTELRFRQERETKEKLAEQDSKRLEAEADNQKRIFKDAQAAYVSKQEKQKLQQKELREAYSEVRAHTPTPPTLPHGMLYSCRHYHLLRLAGGGARSGGATDQSGRGRQVP